MEDIGKHIETLLEGAVEYGKTTVELTKLKAVDRISDIAASLLSVLFAWAALFLLILFASLGLAFWLGGIFGKMYFGFLAVAGIYALLALLIHLFLSKWIKKIICNYIIKLALN